MLTYQGKTQSIPKWGKQFGISDRTIRTRIERGWTVEDALTMPPEHKNTMKSKGAEIKENVRVSFDKIWAKVGKAEFEKQLADAFANDALKVVRDFVQYLPKDAVERAGMDNEKAIVRIEFNQPSTDTVITLENDAT